MTFDHTVISNTASTHRSGCFKSLTFQSMVIQLVLASVNKTHTVYLQCHGLEAIFEVKI